MKKFLTLPALALILLPSCSSTQTASSSDFGGASPGYFSGISNRSGGPMHWNKRGSARFFGAQQSAPAPQKLTREEAETQEILSQLTPEDIENIKKLRKQN